MITLDQVKDATAAFLAEKWQCPVNVESIEKIRALRIPVLLIHGKSDQKIPYCMTKQLYDLAPQPKEIVLIEGGGHANSRAAQGPL